MRAEHPEPGELEEARVDDPALVDVAEAAVVEVVGGGGVRVAVHGQTQEVAMIAVGPAVSHCPRLDVALVIVGGRLVEPGAGRVAGGLREMGGGGEPGDLRGDRGG